jgi:ATP-binding cassette subfamily C protein LapB
MPAMHPMPTPTVTELAGDAPQAPTANTVQPLEACLLFMLAYHGRAMSVAALRATVARPDAPWTAADFVDAVESLGFRTRQGSSATPPAPARNEPLLLLGPQSQACVLLQRLDDDLFEVYLPGGERPRQLGLQQLRAIYDGQWIQVRPPSRMAQLRAGMAQGRRGHWFWGPVLMARPLYARAALAATLTNLFALATSIFSMIVYDRIIPNNAVASLYALLIGVTIVFASDFLIRSLRAYFLDVAGSRADLEIADAVFDQVIDLDMRARRGPSGSLASILKEFETIRDFFTSATLTTLIDIPFALLFIVVLYWIGGPMAWVPVVALPLMIGAGLLLQPTMQRQSQLSQEDSHHKQAVLVETLSGLESVKALGAGAVMRRRWQDAVAHQARLGLQSRMLNTLAANWSNLVFMVSQVAVVTVGVFLAVDGQIGSGAVVAGSILCGRAIQPMAQLSQLLGRLNQSLASYAALSKIMALPREHPADQERLAHDRLRGSIELRDVSFSYPGQTMPILEKVSLRIEPGERVAVIGRVGSGKTTLVKMLIGLYSADSGAVMVGGSDVRQIDPADLRRNVGTVLQDVWLMSGTLRQNIALGADRPSDAQVLAAAELAGVHEFAVLHPDGYQLRLGEGGEGLSGGQRQAVGMARALIGDPPILLFDEPTSAMDPTAERLLLQRLKQSVQGKTLVLVTHKPSMLDLVDRVIVMERGRIIANGPKDAVMRVAAAPPKEAAA